jgi:murein DD-endopeptidase MepM/ murein hydrolase activator NlpD
MTARTLAALVVALAALCACQRTGDPAPVTTLNNASDSAGGAVVVLRGDSVYALARRYNVAVRDLIDVNSLKPPYALEVGQRLVLPATRQYVAQKGDTLPSIARMFGVPESELTRLNRIQPPYAIQAGQTLRLPGRGGAEVAAAPAPSPVARTPVRTVTVQPLDPEPERPVAEPAPATAGGALPPPLPLAKPSSKGAGAPAPATETAEVLPPSKPEPPRPESVKPEPPKPESVKPEPPKPESAKPEPPRADSAKADSAKADSAKADSAKADSAKADSAKSDRADVGAPPPRGATRFLWPVKGKLLSPYGAKPDGTHNDGINIAAAKGTPVVAADNGVVAYAGNELRGFGNLLLIRHADGWITAYAHLDRADVQRGAKVKRGQLIGTVGQSGSVSSPQLHFELRRGSQAVDPRDQMEPGSQVSADGGPAGRPGPG